MHRFSPSGPLGRINRLARLVLVSSRSVNSLVWALLFVAVFSLGQFASLTLALFVSLAAYSGARQWILTQLLGGCAWVTAPASIIWRN